MLSVSTGTYLHARAEEPAEREAADEGRALAERRGATARAPRPGPALRPAGAMLASLGGVSALYHLEKMMEWRRWEEARMAHAERLLRLQQ